MERDIALCSSAQAGLRAVSFSRAGMMVGRLSPCCVRGEPRREETQGPRRPPQLPGVTFCSWLSLAKHVFGGSAVVIGNPGLTWKWMRPGCHGNASCFCLSSTATAASMTRCDLSLGEQNTGGPSRLFLMPAFALHSTSRFPGARPTADLPAQGN